MNFPLDWFSILIKPKLIEGHVKTFLVSIWLLRISKSNEYDIPDSL